MSENLKLKIIKVEDEENPDGIPLYKMTLQSDMGTYIRGVAVSDWEDPRKRRSIEKHWLKSIGAIEEVKKVRNSKTEKVLKAEMKAEIKAIEGTEIDDE